ncbi:hypothetical protein HSIEG1_1168 [Enterococcus sp. HSIEG1]|nr:hypothetical protein HSIEG1_1168 [Enterococcus sp. HSIEG1]
MAHFLFSRQKVITTKVNALLRIKALIFVESATFSLANRTY